jgi:hypothetical protein
MKRPGILLTVTEVVAILLMSLASSYALLGFSVRTLIPFTMLVSVGVLTVVVLPTGSLIFGVASALLLLPTLMKLNGVKWWVFSAERLAFCPDLNFASGLAIGLLIVSGGLLLGYVQPLRLEIRALQRGRIEEEQCRHYAVNQCAAVGSAILVSAVAGGVIVLAIGAVRRGLANWLKEWSWTLPAGGMASLVVLALVLVWLTNRGRIRTRN